MDYSQFLNMPEELSLMAVILLLFVADLFICKIKRRPKKVFSTAIR